MLTASSNSNFDEIVWSSNNDFTDTLSQQANYLTSQALTYYVKISTVYVTLKIVLVFYLI